ncbi:WD40/YVTN/BNR-like repeat-containing protein [Paenibacillus favisporus]|uniref:WD40/YVTN/BNR-like repeat-containing protein n=1 Tax=Paenibacillus favisporus TaxID=221028 RepID=UPI003D29716E
MIMKKLLRSSSLAAAALMLMLPAGWGLSPTQTSAAAAVPAPCGSGDHGLLQQEQKQHMGEGADPLHFTDIQFLNGSTGRAAGTGFMIGTSDAGCHWQEIYTGKWNFAQIKFTDNVNGWAIATLPSHQTTHLLKSVDGGSHWKQVYTANLPFNRLEALGKNTVYGYTQNGAYRTENGGNSWVKIPTPANTRYATFRDKNNGYVLVIVPGSGYKVLGTADGGHSWSTKLNVKFDSPYPAGGQIYSKDNQVWALFYGGSGMSQVSYSLYGSTDQGVHWKRVIAQSTAGGGPAPGSGAAVVNQGPAQPGGQPGNMQLIGKETAFLSGGSPAGGMVSVGVTYNGGKTWKNVKPSINGYDSRISFTDGKTGWLVVTSATKSSIYATHDGGASWNRKFAFKEALNP